MLAFGVENKSYVCYSHSSGVSKLSACSKSVPCWICLSSIAPLQVDTAVFPISSVHYICCHCRLIPQCRHISHAFLNTMSVQATKICISKVQPISPNILALQTDAETSYQKNGEATDAYSMCLTVWESSLYLNVVSWISYEEHYTPNNSSCRRRR